MPMPSQPHFLDLFEVFPAFVVSLILSFDIVSSFATLHSLRSVAFLRLRTSYGDAYHCPVYIFVDLHVHSSVCSLPVVPPALWSMSNFWLQFPIVCQYLSMSDFPPFTDSTLCHIDQTTDQVFTLLTVTYNLIVALFSYSLPPSIFTCLYKNVMKQFFTFNFFLLLSRDNLI